MFRPTQRKCPSSLGKCLSSLAGAVGPSVTWLKVRIDGPTREAWGRALKALIAAVRDGKLKVRGFRAGSEISEEMPPEEFAEEADNPFTDPDFTLEYSGKRFLELDVENGATIRKSHSNGAATVLWTDLCADSGAEVLRLWPSATRKGLNYRKRQATTSAIDEMSAAAVEHTTAKERENAIIKRVYERCGIKITDRYIRLIEGNTRNRRRS
jgi:hypothetical protein